MEWLIEFFRVPPVVTALNNLLGLLFVLKCKQLLGLVIS